MAKLILILVIAAVIESFGVVILARGLKEVQGVRSVTVSEIVRVVKSVVTNSKVIGGTALEALFYGALLYMLSKSDVSFVWPLTSLGFIFTTLAAQFILGEKVALTRWGGVILIALGAFLVSYSEAANKKQVPAETSSTPLRSQ